MPWQAMLRLAIETLRKWWRNETEDAGDEPDEETKGPIRWSINRRRRK